tara:strand:- start:37 stop:612 length:576 start_codon:yes stop_codon:yes gene_type:complete
MNELVFDEEEHKYTYRGRTVPGVTSVLEGVGISDFSMVPKDILQDAMDLGTSVHLTCEYYDKEILDVIPEVAEPYLKQWMAFCDLYNPEWVDIESKVFCDRFFYAGTLDRVALMNGELWIIDIKTGGKSKAHRLQTSAYEKCWLKDKRKKIRRMCVHLTETKFTIEEFKNKTDFDLFLAALTTYNFKKGNI